MKKIGIDPDTEKSGFCVVDTDGTKKKLIELSNLRFYELLERIEHYVLEWQLSGLKYVIVIEKGENNKALFNAHKATSKRVAAKIGMHTGKNFAITDLIVEYCERNKLNYKTYTPTSTKLDHKFISKIFPELKRSNSEQRDAIRCIL